jgi:threonylcarbamoyladenosine tRNA methylthiotransferase MtaB
MEKGKLNIAFLTIGCRANQADTSGMVSAITSRCNVVDLESDHCDIVIVNTCAVTSRAESDCRKLIRRARKLHSNSLIVVTGCATNVNRTSWESMPEVNRVVDFREPGTLAEIISTSNANTPIPEIGQGIYAPTPIHGHKSRPFLKIQDGCSRGCTYCIVPKARGPERSRPLDQVRYDLKLLSEAGFEEIVITGIHLGRWGCDLGLGLRQLLDIFNSIPSNVRIRLSSIEPMDLTPELVREILTSPRICPHLHIPLQSADDRILKAMGRGHTIADFKKIIEACIDANPDVAIGTDIMVGFPGEDEDAFQNTLRYTTELPFAYLHVFTYSPRPLTVAATMPDRPTGEAVKERMRLLKKIDASHRSSYRRAFQGRILPFLIESPAIQGCLPTALSHNYIRIYLQAIEKDLRAGQVVPLILDTIND